MEEKPCTATFDLPRLWLSSANLALLKLSKVVETAQHTDLLIKDPYDT